MSTRQLRDYRMMKDALDEIEDVMERLEDVFKDKMWPVDQVLAARVDVARSVLEAVSNDIRDVYVGWDA